MLQTGDVIKMLHMEKGYTQNELAIMLGLQLSTLQKYESGAILNLKLETLRELYEIFEVPPIMFVFPNYESRSAEVFQWTLVNCAGLSPAGIEKVENYINDLLKIEEYCKKSR